MLNIHFLHGGRYGFRIGLPRFPNLRPVILVSKWKRKFECGREEENFEAGRLHKFCLFQNGVGN